MISQHWINHSSCPFVKRAEQKKIKCKHFSFPFLLKDALELFRSLSTPLPAAFFYGALGKYVDEAKCCVLGCFYGSRQRLLVAAAGLSCAAVGCYHSVPGRPRFQKTPSMGKLHRCSSCYHKCHYSTGNSWDSTGELVRIKIRHSKGTAIHQWWQW